MTKPRDWSVLCVLMLAVLPLIFFWRILTPNALDRGSFPTGDFSEQFYAFAHFSYDEISQGRLPLWNPYTYAGHPFIADVQSAVFYPPSLLVMALSPLFGGFSLYTLEWQAALHFSLAGVFTFIFARRELSHAQSSRWVGNRVNLAAFLTALVFTFGGYLTSYPSQQLAVLESDTWLPLMLLGISLSSEHDRSGPSLLSGVAFGLALLAGHPQSALYLLMVSAAYAFIVGRLHHRSWRLTGNRFALLVAVALGLSAIQWLPSLEFMRLSSRSTLTYNDYAKGFELQDPLQMLLPGSVSYYSPLYVGIVPLALVLLSLWLPRRPQRIAVFWLGVALFALALSFGGNVFLYPVLYLFAPGFALFRQQERAAFIFSFALAMLAGYGALALEQPLTLDARRRLCSFARLSVAMLAAAVVLFILAYFGWSIASLRADSPFRDVSTRAAWLLVMLGVSAGLLWARRHGALRRSSFAFALVLAAGLDLFSVNWHTNLQAAPPEAQTRAPDFLAPILSDGGLFRTYNEYRIFGNFGDTFRIEDVSGASPLRLARYDQFYKLPMERIWSLLNVKYVITWRKSLAEMGVQSEIVATQKISDSESTYVHRLQTVGPRAAVVTQIERVSSFEEALQRLSAPDFDPAHTAIIEGQSLSLPASNGAGTVILVNHTPANYQWQVNAPGDALLVLAENDYPGWHAFVSGSESPLLRVNAVMMGVRVPAGSSIVSFIFDPQSVKLGALVTVTTLAALAVALAALWRKRQRYQNPSAA